MTPIDTQSQIQTLVAAFQQGKEDEARRLADVILARVPGEPTAAQVKGMLLIREGKPTDAVKVLEAGRKVMPDHPHLLNTLGVAQKQTGDREGAWRTFAAAAGLDAQYVDPHLNLGNLALEDDARVEARKYFETVLKAQPQNAQALTGLGRLALADGQAEEALRLAGEVLTRAPENVLALLCKAQAHLALGAWEDASKAAEQALVSPQASPTNRALARGLQGEAAEKRGDYADAFDFFEHANRLLRDIHQGVMDEDSTAYHPQTIARVAAYLTHIPHPDNTPTVEGPAPVFLLGFPRSGTTLLEQVLLTHPLVETIEEQDTLEDATDDLLLGQDGLLRLLTMRGAEAMDFRTAYWRRVEALGKVVPEGGVLIDKLPLATALLPMVAKIFPDAKFLFALRDPRDVVLSCFQQRFGMNQAMYQFLDLETAAQYYDQIMCIGMGAREVYELDLMDIRYEDVVDDLEAQARGVINFLGLPWDDGVLGYREAAQQRRINTPSIRQVTQPIYKTARHKWRNYEAAMAPVRPLLDPWAARFGYEG